MRASPCALALALALAGCFDPALPTDEPPSTSSTSSTEQAATTGPAGTYQTSLVAAGDHWAYYDRGGLDGISWRTTLGCVGGCFLSGKAPFGYGESGLATTIGYGPDPAHKYITSYFRAAFFLRRPVHA